MELTSPDPASTGPSPPGGPFLSLGLPDLPRAAKALRATSPVAGSVLTLSATGLVVGSALALSATASAALAQEVAPRWATLSQQVDIDMSAGDGSADVVIRYRFGPAEEGGATPSTEPITLELLGFGEAIPGEIRVVSTDPGPTAPDRAAQEEPVVLWPTVGSHRMAVVEPLMGDVSPVDGSGAAGARTLTMTVSYRIENVVEGDAAPAARDRADVGDRAEVTGSAQVTGPADAEAEGLPETIHVRVPIVTGPSVRTAGGGEAFQARLEVPEVWAVSEGFPAGLRAGDDGVHSVSLTVAPSIVGFRASTDGRRRPGFPLVVDVLTLLILTTFAGFGWRHLRIVAR